MYKKTLACVVCLGVMIWWFVTAFSSYEGNESDVKISVPVYDDYYVAGASIKVSSDIKWDLIAAWGNVIIEGIINQDLTVAGGMIHVQGTVQDDMKAAGGEVTINATVGDDVMIAWGGIIIDKNAHIKWDVVIVWGQVQILGTIDWNLDVSGGGVIIEGTVSGSVHASVETIVMGKNAHIQGNVEYTSKNEIPNMQTYVQWKVSYTKVAADISSVYNEAQDIASSRKFSKRIFLVAFGLLMYFGIKKTVQDAAEYGMKKPGYAFLKGIWFLAITPLVLLLLLISFVGIGFALVWVAIYIFVWSILSLLATVTLTHVVMVKLLPIKKYIILTEVAVLLVLGGICARIPFLPVLLGIWSLWCYMSLSVLVSKPKSLI